MPVFRIVSDDSEVETEVVLRDPEPEGVGDASHVQPIQTAYEPNYWVDTLWGWVKSPFGTDNIKLSLRDSLMGLL